MFIILGDLVNKKYKFTPGNYLLEKFNHNQNNLSNENYSDLLKMEFYNFLQQIKQQIQRENLILNLMKMIFLKWL